MGLLVLGVEGIPQLLILAMVMTHWHGEFNTAALSFFIKFVDVPLILWYLQFYCDEQTMYVVIGKVMALAITTSAEHWADFVVSYIHNEREHEYDAIDSKTNKGYDVSNLRVVILYQLGYLLSSPLIGKTKYVIFYAALMSHKLAQVLEK